MGEGELLNAIIFKSTPINVGGYVLIRHRSWQHQLPKQRIKCLVSKEDVFFWLWAVHQMLHLP